MNRFRVITSLVVVCGVVACNDSSLRGIDRLLSGPTRIDFGDAYVGDRLDEAATFSAIADGKVRLNLLSAPADLRVPEELSATPGSPASALFRWEPLSPGDLLGEIVFGVDTDNANEWRIEVVGFAEAWPACDDGDGCTGDAFDRPTETCVHRPLDDVACDDASACTGGDVCVSGVCLGVALSCNDELGCTTDACDPLIGCVFVPNPAHCFDGDPCTQDVCDLDSGCENPLAESWTPCGSFDCSIGHFCFIGECIELDISTASDGLPCDDGRVCTDEGQCLDGACEPGPTRPPEVVAHLPTFGTNSSLAFDGRRYVYVDTQDLDLVEARQGVLHVVATLPIRSTMAPLPVEPGRFLILTVAQTVVLLDSDNAVVLWETPITFAPPPLPAGGTFVDQRVGGYWTLAHGGIVLSTWTTYTPADGGYDQQQPGLQHHAFNDGLSPPVDLNAPGYRVEGSGSLLAWTGPYGEGLGVFYFFNEGSPWVSVSLTPQEVSALGCGQPKDILWYEGGFATLSEEVGDLGYQRPLCFWNAVADDPNGFGLEKARRWSDHIHNVSFARLDDTLFLGSYLDGYSPQQSVRLRAASLSELRAGTGNFSAAGLLMVHPVAPARLAAQAGQVLFMGELSYPLVATGAALSPLSGPGLGRFDGLAPIDRSSGAVLGGGVSMAATVDVTNPRVPAYTDHLAWLPEGYPTYLSPSVVRVDGAEVVGLVSSSVAHFTNNCLSSQDFVHAGATWSASSRDLCPSLGPQQSTRLAVAGPWLVYTGVQVGLRRLVDWSELVLLDVPFAPAGYARGAEPEQIYVSQSLANLSRYELQAISLGDVPALEGEVVALEGVPAGGFCPNTCDLEERLAIDGPWILVTGWEDPEPLVAGDSNAFLFLYPRVGATAPVASLALGPFREGFPNPLRILAPRGGRAFVQIGTSDAAVLVQVAYGTGAPLLREVGRLPTLSSTTAMLDWDSHVLRAGYGGLDVIAPACEEP